MKLTEAIARFGFVPALAPGAGLGTAFHAKSGKALGLPFLRCGKGGPGLRIQLSTHPGSRLVAVSDNNTEVAAKLAAQYGADARTPMRSLPMRPSTPC